MKKFIALLLSILCLSAPVLAEEVNFDGMDLAALLALHEKLDAAIQEQMDCLLDENYIYQGIYAVGKDIVPGYYCSLALKIVMTRETLISSMKFTNPRKHTIRTNELCLTASM